MFSVLMTSTMKSDPSGPVVFASSFGVEVSAAAMRASGRSADGRAGAAGSATGAVAALTACGATVVAAPVSATPAMNLRRLTSASLRAELFDADFLDAISSSLSGSGEAVISSLIFP